MRLSKIKLAGFKSFVDPTTIPLISNLTSVAGPNGCGKSNVIDAVRWVMGESSAKNLRGGALTDVIFSGSSARKPVGQATVELVFDNSDGKIGGEYASYAEIAIKRQVTRDGQSNYFLNGQRCRRRDITDIFLGTGLGPRSYAIIEQGMISRVIDAKPEELRVFIEEAAGISKYKERRRETENRIKHTQENLARLNDLRQELETQLNRLQRQSQAAKQYQELKAEEKIISLQLAALAWHRLDQAISNVEAQIREGSIQFEAKQAEIQHVKTHQEKLRLEYTESNDALNEVQKQYYGLGSEIARIEQQIAHQQERFTELNQDKVEAENTLAIAQKQMAQDDDMRFMLNDELALLLPHEEQLIEDELKAQSKLQDAENAQNKWREEMALVQQQVIAPTRIAEAEKAKIALLERQIQQTQMRQTRLEEELKQLGVQEANEVESQRNKIAHLEEQVLELEEQIDELTSNKQQQLQRQQQLNANIKQTERALNESVAQKMALEALQAKALGKDTQAKSDWLSSQGLSDSVYLAEKLEVEKGWEKAVETVLFSFIQGLVLENRQIDQFALQLQSDFSLTLLEWPQTATNRESNPECLVHYIGNKQFLPKTIFDLLACVRVARSLEEAVSIAKTSGQSVITTDGLWVGPDWISCQAQSEDESGMLVREEKLKIVTHSISEQEEKLGELQLNLEDCEKALKDLDLQKETLQQEKNTNQKEIISLEGELRMKLNKIEQHQKRAAQIEGDLKESRDSIAHYQQDINVSRSSLNKALDDMSQFNDLQESLSQQKEAIQESLNGAKHHLKEISGKKQELALKLQTLRTNITALTSNIERFKEQIETAKARVQAIIQALAKNEEPLVPLKNELQINLDKRLEIEDHLNNARDKVAHIDNQLRESEHALTQFEQNLQKLREQLEHVRMEWQALCVRKENAAERLKDAPSIETILAGTPEGATEAGWQERINEIEARINKLGAINLAAIEEFDAAKERKEYLDAQLNDLTEALTTLENAIKKIDKETRMKFEETFNQVNDEFMRLFPRLFGGGQAQLTMTGEDLLDTGITLMARPPGKKNSSIQLLSGGEKALTAIALVFSIFRLNPAPFCMLDEVDAPLDDSNVVRFCDMVKEMSKTVQFVYISHNKITIEMAEQLHGVTMREAGVSRLVSVDIEEAKSLATA